MMSKFVLLFSLAFETYALRMDQNEIKMTNGSPPNLKIKGLGELDVLSKSQNSPDMVLLLSEMVLSNGSSPDLKLKGYPGFPDWGQMLEQQYKIQEQQKMEHEATQVDFEEREKRFAAQKNFGSKKSPAEKYGPSCSVPNLQRAQFNCLLSVSAPSTGKCLPRALPCMTFTCTSCG